MSMPRPLHWLDVAVAAKGQPVEALIRPIAKAGEAPCYGITLAQRWVFGGDGRLTAFDSPDAASRFLHLLGVRHIHRRGVPISPDAPLHQGVQVYRIRRRKLQACDRSIDGRNGIKPTSLT